MEKLKTRQGWVVCLIHKNGTRDPITPVGDCEVTGIGELLYRKKIAKQISDKINKSWGYKATEVKKARLQW